MRQRSLWRLYRELYAILEGHRGSIALAMATLSVSTLLRLLPPAATKLVIDYVLLRRPLPEAVTRRVPIPDDAQGAADAAGGGGAGRLDGRAGHRALGTLAGDPGEQAGAGRRPQAGLRARGPAAAAPGLSAQVGGASSLIREDAGGVGELIFSMLYNPWRAVVQLAGGVVVLAWVDWRLLLGGLCLAPGVIFSDRLWNGRLRPLFRDIRKQRQEIDARAAEVFGGMRVVRAFGRQRRESSRFVGESHLMARQELYAWWWSRFVEVLWELLLPMASAALLLYGGLQVLDGRLTLGDLMMFLVYLAMLLEPLAVLATSVTQLQNNLSGLRPRARPPGRADRDGRPPRHRRPPRRGGRRPRSRSRA